MRIGFAKIKFFEKSGARLYIPQKLIKDSAFPFEDGDLVKIVIGNDSLRLATPEWWELLDWNTMKQAYFILPEDVKKKIKDAGLAPSP